METIGNAHTICVYKAFPEKTYSRQNKYEYVMCIFSLHIITLQLMLRMPQQVQPDPIKKLFDHLSRANQPEVANPWQP